MKSEILEVFFIVSVWKIVSVIATKNIQLVPSGITKLGFMNEKIVIDCPIQASFYLWRLYQNGAEPRALLEQDNKRLVYETVTPEKSGIYECRSTTGFANAVTNITVKIIDPESTSVKETCSLKRSPTDRKLIGLCFLSSEPKRMSDDSVENVGKRVYYADDSAEFDCTAVGEELSYHWTFIGKNGMPIEISTSYNISRIKINRLSSENEGQYKCEIMDKYDEKLSRYFNVELKEKLSGTDLDVVGSKNVTIISKSDTSINLHCEFRSKFIWIHSVKWGKRAMDINDPRSVIVWDHHNYQPLNSSKSERINQNHITSTYLLSNLKSEDSGIYTCVAINSRGHTESKIFNLTVLSDRTQIEQATGSHFVLLYILLPAIIIFGGICAIVVCCVRGRVPKSPNSLPLKTCKSKHGSTDGKEPVGTNYYVQVPSMRNATNCPPLPQPNESQASLVSPNTLTSYSSYGNYHIQSSNQPSYCSSNGV